MQMRAWLQAGLEQAAEPWLQQLQYAGLQLEVQVAPQVNARHLRLHPDMAVIYDQDGLSLAANGMKIQPDWVGQLPRLKRASKKNELIARACHIEDKTRVLDCTAGLGHDALLLAWLGAEVYLLERHPVLYTLLCASQQQASQHAALAEVVQRMHIVHTDSVDYLQQLQVQQFDVIYLDPMFPKPAIADKKQAQVKKDMQILHQLLSDNAIMDLGENLLPFARHISSRVVVKRPRHAQFLSADEPQHQWLGDACRFDAYFQVLQA